MEFYLPYLSRSWFSRYCSLRYASKRQCFFLWPRATTSRQATFLSFKQQRRLRVISFNRTCCFPVWLFCLRSIGCATSCRTTPRSLSSHHFGAFHVLVCRHD